MTQNVGSTDRLIRMVIALVALTLGILFLSGTWAIVAFVLAGIMALTATVSVCPLYMPFKISTKK